MAIIPCVLTCPECGNKQLMEIPSDKCQSFYQCEKCRAIVRAKKTCCVFCDYGDSPCPAAAKHKK